MSNVLSVNEIFGPTIQGEGITAGEPCFFLRLAGCNLHCVWCDTPYAWDWKRYKSSEEAHPLELSVVLDKLTSYAERYPHVKRLVVSGGEPMLQQAGLRPVLAVVKAWGWAIEIETNGTRAASPALTELVTFYNVSPKLTHSGHKLDETINGPVLMQLAQTGKAVFKFVVETTDDLYTIQSIVDDYHLTPVVIMPQGRTHAELLARARVLFDGVVERGWSLGGRMQVELFGNMRGI